MYNMYICIYITGIHNILCMYIIYLKHAIAILEKKPLEEVTFDEQNNLHLLQEY